MLREVPTRELKEIGAVELVFEPIKDWRAVLFVGSNTTAAVDGAAAVSHLDIVGIAGDAVLVKAVVEERFMRVIALNQTAAGRVEMCGGQRQSSALGKRKDGLHQSFAERSLAQNPCAVVILQSAGHNFRRRGAIRIDQHDDGIFVATETVAYRVGSGWIFAPARRDHRRAAAQESSGNIYGFIQDSAGIVTQIEDESLE